MMVYDAFAKRVISGNKLIPNNLASKMMLLLKKHFKNYSASSWPYWVSGLIMMLAINYFCAVILRVMLLPASK